MNSSEMVTDFSLEKDGKQVTTSELIKALNLHCKAQLEGESFCCIADWKLHETSQLERVPERYWQLIAFAIEGGSEGWYVHVGAIIAPQEHGKPTIYKDFGFAKVWSVEASFAVQKEAQRFLTAARWN